jgi:hypothetical protein
MQWSRLCPLALAGFAILGVREIAMAEKKDSTDARVERGLTMAPVLLNLNGLSKRSVGLGSYLVNAVSSCADCHSCPMYVPGQSPFKGGSGALDATHYLGGGVPFGPTLKAPSITPDAQGRPAGMTAAEFVQTMRTGHTPHEPNDILEIMPWPSYRRMTDEDLLAIYDYLRAIPQAQPGTCTGAGQ